jgi:hypothetical protein
MLQSDVLLWGFLSSWHVTAAFKIWNFKIFWKINLTQTARIHYNNLDCKSLNISGVFSTIGNVAFRIYIYTPVEC